MERFPVWRFENELLASQLKTNSPYNSIFMQIRDKRGNRAVMWDNYKAGVIDTETEEIIVPIRFDEVSWRIQTFRSPCRMVPPLPTEYAGFACFTNEGEEVILDMNGKPDELKYWEANRIRREEPESPEESLEEIEDEIRKLYYEDPENERLKTLLYTRMRLIDRSWEHSVENAKLMSEVSDRLNKAVQEALSLGETIQKTLSGNWGIDVEVTPEWEDEDIRNIVAECGHRTGITSTSPCFQKYEHSHSEPNWDFKSSVLDDGVSWDWGFRMPVYMDCYFYMPFQLLAADNYAFAYSDLLTIKQFNINIQVTKAADA